MVTVPCHLSFFVPMTILRDQGKNHPNYDVLCLSLPGPRALPNSLYPTSQQDEYPQLTQELQPPLRRSDSRPQTGQEL